MAITTHFLQALAYKAFKNEKVLVHESHRNCLSESVYYNNLQMYLILTAGTVDNIDPVISNCPQDVVVTANTGASSAPAFWNAPTAMDASGMVTLHSVSASPGDSFPLGSTPVTYIFSDAFGNTAECSFNVIVNAGE